uniref:Uncharacterized protein n=1 Tax=Ciona intestinalis TaxID=7719 RepID=H2XWC4_CIOIN
MEHKRSYNKTLLDKMGLKCKKQFIVISSNLPKKGWCSLSLGGYKGNKTVYPIPL